MTTVGIDMRESPVAIGSLVSKYRIVSVIGRGGYAWVFRASDPFLGRDVAIKILHRAGGVTPEMLRRGQAEARLLIKLRHPNIVDTFDAGMTDDGLLFIVMELLVGRSLFAALRELGRLTEHEAIAVFVQVAQAVAHAHSMGAIHRDLKPENIFVTESGIAKVLDFGIAKITDDGVPMTTKKDVWLGTVLYMSPEQVQGVHVSFGSDIYSLGMVYWEALGGIHPLLIDCESPSPLAVAMMHTTKIPPPIHKFRTDVPKELSRIVDRAISKKVQERYPSMGALADALREYQATRVAQLNNAKPTLRKLSGETVDHDGGFAPVPSALQVLPSGGSNLPKPPTVNETETAPGLMAPAASAVTKPVARRTLRGMGEQSAEAVQAPIEARTMARVSSPPRGTPSAMSRHVTPRRALTEPVGQRSPKRLGWFQAMLIGGSLGVAAFGAVTVGLFYLKPKKQQAIATESSAVVITQAPIVELGSTPAPPSTEPTAELPVVNATVSATASAATTAPKPVSKARKRDRLDDKLKALDDELSNSSSRTRPTLRYESPE